MEISDFLIILALSLTSTILIGTSKSSRIMYEAPEKKLRSFYTRQQPADTKTCERTGSRPVNLSPDQLTHSYVPDTLEIN